MFLNYDRAQIKAASSFLHSRLVVVLCLIAAGCTSKLSDEQACSSLTLGPGTVVERCTKLLETSTERQSGKFKVALTNRGSAYNALNRPELAIMDFNNAIQIDPDDVEAHFGRASALHQMDKIDLAAQEMERVLALEPSSANFRMDSGTFHFRLGQEEQAQSDFSEAIKLDPTLSSAYEWRGGTEFVAKDFASAERDFEVATTLQPGNPEPIVLHFFAAARNGRAPTKEQLITASQKGLKNKWPAPMLRVLTGQQTLKEFMELPNLDARTDGGSVQESRCDQYFYIGEYLLIQKKPEFALEQFQKAVAICPAYYPNGILARSELRADKSATN